MATNDKSLAERLMRILMPPEDFYLALIEEALLSKLAPERQNEVLVYLADNTIADGITEEAYSKCIDIWAQYKPEELRTIIKFLRSPLGEMFTETEYEITQVMNEGKAKFLKEFRHLLGDFRSQ